MASLLLIEDDDTQRLLAAGILRQAGHEVHEASDGLWALELTCQVSFDAVICDVQLPGLHGMEVVSRIRTQVRHADVPILMLTALADRAHMRVAMTAGADDYLTKPFRAHELRDAVQVLLDKRQARRAMLREQSLQRARAQLAEERERIAQTYEDRLLAELGRDAGRDLRPVETWAQMLVVAVDLTPPPGLGDPAALLPLMQRTVDAAMLFGARRLLSVGPLVLSLFHDGETVTPRTRLQALRAAWGVAKAQGQAAGMPGLPQAAGSPVVLDAAALTLLNVGDLSDTHTQLSVPQGPLLQRLPALLAVARSRNRAIAATPAALEGVASAVETGARDSVPLPGGEPLVLLELRNLLAGGVDAP